MGFMAPFPRNTKRSQQFGAFPGGYNPPGGHTGTDYAVWTGTPVHAPADGIIRASSWLSLYSNDWLLTDFGGDTLVVDCFDANGETSTMPTFVYAHLFESTAPVGKRVKKGEVIGISGNSGTATSGDHCHVEALPPYWDVNNGTYGRVDPDLYFTEYPGEITAQSTKTPVKIGAVAPVEESEMPAHDRITVSPVKAINLGKGSAWALKEATLKTNQNYAVNGKGHYLVTLNLKGAGLPDGEALTVLFRVVTKGKSSSYFTQRINGNTSGQFDETVIFNNPLAAGQFLEVDVTSSAAGTSLSRWGADVATWK